MQHFSKRVNWIILPLFLFQISIAQESITLQLQWLPQAQFAGYLIAHQQGFYHEAGLDVEIQFGGPAISPFDSLIQNKATFCTGWLTEGIARRARGAAVVHVAQIVQRSGLMFITKKSANIRKPEDMNGKTIGTWQGDFLLQPTLFFKQRNIRANIVIQAYSIDPFLRGAVDIASAMYYNEYHRIYEAGLDTTDIVTFLLADYGLNYPEDGIYCLEKTWQTSSPLCRQFIAASIKGWQWAFINKTMAVDMVMHFCIKHNVATSRNHQVWMLQAMESLMDVDQNRTIDIQLKPHDFERVLNGLEDLELVGDKITYSEFHPHGGNE